MRKRVIKEQEKDRYYSLAFLVLLIVLSLFFTSCSKSENVITCPEGYTGQNCEQEKSPAYMHLNSFTLLSWPTKSPAGLDWDSDGSQELSFHLIKEGEKIFFYTGYIQSNEAGELLEFSLPEPFIFIEPEESYTLEVVELDGSQSEVVAAFNFVPYKSGLSFPDYQILTAPGTATGSIDIAYIF
jgi:hypothetical protein